MKLSSSFLSAAALAASNAVAGPSVATCDAAFTVAGERLAKGSVEYKQLEARQSKWSFLSEAVYGSASSSEAKKAAHRLMDIPHEDFVAQVRKCNGINVSHSIKYPPRAPNFPQDNVSHAFACTRMIMDYEDSLSTWKRPQEEIVRAKAIRDKVMAYGIVASLEAGRDLDIMTNEGQDFYRSVRGNPNALYQCLNYYAGIRVDLR